MNHVKCGRCVRCGREYPAVPNLTNCECGGILDIIYDYDQIKTVLTRETLKNRTERSMWRYRELLPVEPETPAPPLRVGWSPLYEADRLAKELGIAKLWVKDDGQNPTASLKDRASAMAVAKAQEAGAHVIHGQRRLVPCRQRRGRRAQDVHFRPVPRTEGQGRPAYDVRRDRHLRAGQL